MCLNTSTLRSPETRIVTLVKKWRWVWHRRGQPMVVKSCMTNGYSIKKRAWTPVLQQMISTMFMTAVCLLPNRLLSTLYRPEKDADDEMYGGANEQLEKIRKTDRFKPDKEFTGAGERSGPRDGPVEFEREVVEDADPFGLDQFIIQVKGGKKETA
ncbi:putative SKI-interacting protein, SKIP [Helianthus annuus]|nr:putative SKI-interacting protein, SKIP [Helianthus annuus]